VPLARAGFATGGRSFKKKTVSDWEAFGNREIYVPQSGEERKNSHLIRKKRRNQFGGFQRGGEIDNVKEVQGKKNRKRWWEEGALSRRGKKGKSDTPTLGH